MTTTTTDPIADMLARIRNAALVGRTEVQMPHSNIKEEVGKVLAKNHFIDSTKVAKDGAFKTLVITICEENQKARFSEITRLSRPGRRQYANHTSIPTIKQGRGIVILSTSRGLLTGEEAKTAGVGGELLASIY